MYQRSDVKKRIYEGPWDIEHGRLLIVDMT